MPILVNMVNNFGRLKEAAEVLFHDKPVLHHVALRVCERMVWSEECVIAPAPTIFNSTDVSLAPTRLPLHPTIKRAETLTSLARRCAWRGAHFAGLGVLYVSPSCGQVARSGAVRLLRAAVLRVKLLIAFLAPQYRISVFHSPSIARYCEIEERYCEIAAKRLAQEVLTFDTAEVA